MYRPIESALGPGEGPEKLKGFVPSPALHEIMMASKPTPPPRLDPTPVPPKPDNKVGRALAVGFVLAVWVGTGVWAVNQRGGGGSVEGTEEVVKSLNRLRTNKAAGAKVIAKKLRDHQFKNVEELRAESNKDVLIVEGDAFGWESDRLNEALKGKWDDEKIAQVFDGIEKEFAK